MCRLIAADTFDLQKRERKLLDLVLHGNTRAREYDLNVSRKKKPAVTLAGTVEKIIPASAYAGEPEKAEIAVEGAEPLYKEIRVENKLQDEEGKEVGLISGAEVEVTIEAERHQTTPKKPAATSNQNRRKKKSRKPSELTAL